jgi:hypothetical protein
MTVTAALSPAWKARINDAVAKLAISGGVICVVLFLYYWFFDARYADELISWMRANVVDDLAKVSRALFN